MLTLDSWQKAFLICYPRIRRLFPSVTAGRSRQTQAPVNISVEEPSVGTARVQLHPQSHFPTFQLSRDECEMEQCGGGQWKFSTKTWWKETKSDIILATIS